MTTSLYGDLLAAGVLIDSHESDLYFEDTPASRAILARWPDKASTAKRFPNYHNAEIAWWWDVPFAFLPFWEAVAEREAKRAEGRRLHEARSSAASNACFGG